ncbi:MULTISPECIES: NAD(P)-dependent oxidoreductase [unclassified Spiroplasma]|uniref:NAD(P)-dependent oxidoreductase n=1 Tax=unclassified Spiroplasma TaxID=2637901 RepID=UPI00207A78D1|nr:NAD(P)H-binding protein [Spiroplasma endosymbiont of Lariophagus distinguendus]
MKIGIIGASGKSGLALTKEALKQGYQVVAITRNPIKMPILNNDNRLTIKKADLTNKSSIKAVVNDVDILISAYGPTIDNPQNIHQQVAKNLITIMHECQNIKRLLIVGGAGSLLDDKNEILVETSAFPEAWKEHAQQQVQALATYRSSDINWTYFSPSLYYDPELPTLGKFKIGNNHLIVNKEGKSEISYGDAAIAIINEIKEQKFIKKRFTAGYN